jgi:hypothetical protein
MIKKRNKMKFFKTSIVLIGLLIIGTSCDDFLSYQPKGVVSEVDLETAEGVEGLVTAAYAAMGNDNWHVPHSTPWTTGSVRAEDTFKGGLSTDDQGDFHFWELHSILQTDNPRNNQLWDRLYIGVSRANSAIKNISAINDVDYPNKQQRLAEVRFIRGYFYFQLKRIYKNIPWVDETADPNEIANITNREFTSQELWDKIAADFEVGANVLPMSSGDMHGRIDGLAAKAFLARTLLYQAYEQDDNHKVININQAKLERVVQLSNEVINSEEFSLFDDYGKNFLWEFENGEESIFAVQRTINDGTNNENVTRGTALNWPVTPDYGCCSFNRPTVTMANAFQTDEGGVPKFDTFNEVSNMTNEDFQVRTFDVRLGHTIPIPDEPFKNQKDLIYRPDNYVRTQQLYGPFTDLKVVQPRDCACLFVLSVGVASSKNEDLLRYDNLLLWKAEALIQLNRHQEALPIINQIRERAINSTERLEGVDGNLIANFSMDVYTDGININWSKENALKALQWERWLEFGTEGERFFDLVRWGIAADKINEYLSIESQRFPFLSNGNFVEGTHEYMPIPEQQIDFSDGSYTQNPGY